MTKCAFIPNFLRFYNILWQTALPFLKQNPRLNPTFSKRTGTDHLEKAEIWIQAASAGEAFLALSILNTLAPDHPVRVLVTTTTDQGLEILKQGHGLASLHPHVTPVFELFPFDMPDSMNSAVKKVNPRVMVLLETELWPAFLHALKKNKTQILVLNARMSAKSCRHYRVTSRLWNCFAPDRILATSLRDARRYAGIFPHTTVGTMANIKFDIMDTHNADPGRSSLAAFLPDSLPLSILASVRRQEEPQLIKILSRLKKEYPSQVIAVFPRHMHRIDPIQKQLKKHRLAFVLGSQLTAPLPGPAIVLWDRFGELRPAYGHGATVFVGGSLCPLGGQNFLEPAILGIPTITGPYWDDFAWVGKEIFDRGMVTRCRNWQGVVDTMLTHLKTRRDTTESRQKAFDYIMTRRGGSQTACRAILKALKK